MSESVYYLKYIKLKRQRHEKIYLPEAVSDGRIEARIELVHHESFHLSSTFVTDTGVRLDFGHGFFQNIKKMGPTALPPVFISSVSQFSM